MAITTSDCPVIRRPSPCSMPPRDQRSRCSTGRRSRRCAPPAGPRYSVSHAARPDASVLTIIGAGVQGHAHLDLVPLVRDIDEIRIVSSGGEQAAVLAARDVRARVVEEAEDAVRGADIVCLCTTSGSSVIEDDWVGTGTHVTSVGYFPPLGELPPALAARAELIVETRAAFEPTPVGCGELAGLDPARQRSNSARSSTAHAPAGRATTKSPSTSRWATRWRISSPPNSSIGERCRSASANRIAL